MKWKIIIPVLLVLLLPGAFYLEMVKTHFKRTLAQPETGTRLPGILEETGQWETYIRDLDPKERAALPGRWKNPLDNGQFMEQVLELRRRFYQQQHFLSYPRLLTRQAGGFFSRVITLLPETVQLSTLSITLQGTHLEFRLEGHFSPAPEPRGDFRSFYNGINRLPGVLYIACSYRYPEPISRSTRQIFTITGTLETP